MILNLDLIPVSMGTGYPDEFKAAVAGRSRQRLGEAAGLKNFGVNLTTLAPGSQSALRHWHSHQDEFVYVVQGELVLVTDAGEQLMTAGMMAAFPAAAANGHHLINRSQQPAIYLEVGDRTAGDQVEYPDHDLRAIHLAEGGWQFVNRQGQAYD